MNIMTEGFKVTPQTIFTVKSKLGVLNPNPSSEILYQEIFENFQNEAVS